MKNIIVLVDYTEGCKIALRQALVIAKKSSAKITSLNIQLADHPVQVAFDKLTAFTKDVLGPDEKFTVLVHGGDLFHVVAEVIRDLNPDLVVFCTHGMHGVAQYLFGGHALKLVQSLPYPTLVVQENTKVNLQGINKILFGVSPFSDIHFKSHQTALLAKVFDAEVIIYEIEKYLGNTETDIGANTKLVEEYFTENSVRFSYLKEENKIISMGFTRQTVAFAMEHNMDAISMMSEVQDYDALMLKADKETMISNEAGIPVLCCSGNFLRKLYEI